MIKIIGVRLGSAGKTYYFDPKDYTLRMGEHVVVETAKGPRFGTVSTGARQVEDDQVAQPLRAVIRPANEQDEQEMAELRRREREALRTCREKVRAHKLDMKMVDAEYTPDGGKLLFYFTADGRVDFRELVKDLAGEFHVRIELRQIGVRDETRMLGGLGTCGRELCCATFLRDFQPVSIKMAKEQNLSLNPTKISGACGRLMCCLKNEEDTYEFLNAKMPKMNEEAVTADGQVGRVVELDVLRQRVRVLFEEGDSKEVEVFPVEELTFRGRRRRDPAGQEKNRQKKERSEHSAKDERRTREERSDRRERAGRKERPDRQDLDAANRENRQDGQENRADHQERSDRQRPRRRRNRRANAEGKSPEQHDA